MRINKQWFQTHKRLVELILLFAIFSINGLINATTVLMQDMRGNESAFLTWEPFVWELSSAYSTLLLFPLIALFTEHFSWQWKYPLKSFLRYTGAAIVFSLLHVCTMVLVREFAYGFTASEYDFATNTNTFVFELFYEIRKDVWSFTFFVVVIEVYRYALYQWLGDTKPIFQSSVPPAESHNVLPEVLLVKKTGKEFLIKTREVQWAESAGNYINLRIDEAIYPMRITMADFAEQAKFYGFVRTHRSQVINTHWIEHIKKLPSGDADIKMRDGTVLKLSRRFKKEFDTFVTSLSTT
ncbi:LytTR family DNA-binding domain-containing protein [Idiomarina sp. ST20R2A10]|uniref:LytTR family DNA-binding domain-containing protein n=1 Tax=Idiomarina sp. ST20R2A10 TaxID=3418369 RepID=UPI003F6E117B